MALCQNCLDLELVSALLGRHTANSRRSQYIPGGHLDEYWIPRFSDKRQVWTWSQNRDCTFCDFVRSFILTVTGSPPENIHSKLLLNICDSARKQVTKSATWDKWRYVSAHLVPSSNVVANGQSIHGSPQTLIGWFGSAGPPSSDIIGQDNELTSVRETTDNIDLTELRGLLEMCVHTHERCQPNKEGIAQYPTNLRLIDCTTRCIVRAHDEPRYAALSYQWGSSVQHSAGDHATELPPHVPATIEDAMTVTSGLGLRYLWVDAYCIIQSSPEDFQHQVRQMDLVYTRAHVTLIAAFGSGAESGIPGISCTAERSQAKGCYDDMPLLSFAGDAWDSVKRSPWCSRGWTFQESFFSVRRLIFTVKQYILDCCERSLAESEVHEQFTSSYRNAPLPRWSPGLCEKAVLSLIEEYTARQLTYADDILNAFQGIASAFEAVSTDFRFHCGIPMAVGQSGRHDSFVTNLLWYKRETHNAANVPKRRESFPSWSWTGWTGAVSFDEIAKGENRIVMAVVEQVLLSAEPSRWACWSAFEKLCIDKKMSLDQAHRFVLSAPSIGVALSQQLSYIERGPTNTLIETHAQYTVHLTSRHQYRANQDLYVFFEKLTDIEYDPIPGLGFCVAALLVSDPPYYYFLLLTRLSDRWERVGLWTPVFSPPYHDFGQALVKSKSFKVRKFCLG